MAEGDDAAPASAAEPLSAPEALAALELLYRSPAAHQRYDEAVTELEHALQCATLADREGADVHLVTAALLHDVGHLLPADNRRVGDLERDGHLLPTGYRRASDLERDGHLLPTGYRRASDLERDGHLLPTGYRRASDLEEDRRHERSGSRYLARWFPRAVVEPIALHVAAKRYLCTVEAGYGHRLSDGSMHSLGVQGGPMDADEIRAFEEHPSHGDAVALRRWDDRAKVTGLNCRPFPEWIPTLASAVGRA